MNNNFNFNKLTPFKWYVLENFPFIEADFDALTEWQLFCKLGKEINKVIDSQNLVGEQAETLTEAFNNLKDYVDNYFENLDVQEEINNKLNDMVEDGTLSSLLNEYVSIKYILPGNWGNQVASGNSFLIKAFNKNILMDCNTQETYTYLRRMLQDNQVTHLDYVIISHYHRDHMQGFSYLVADGFVDETTVVYAPPLTNTTPMTYYNEIHNICSTNNIQIIVPDELSTLTLQGLKITFYNTDADYDNANYTDYNDCSLICLLEHYDLASLWMGDAGVRPMRKMETNNFIKRQINFYQIEHHAINGNTQISFIKHISPKISYAPTQLSDVSQNKIGQNPTYKILQNIGCKNILACSNQENIVISSNNSAMIIEKGLITQSVSQCDLDLILYVDINTTNSIQNGTEAYPFKDIPQALGFIDNVNTSYNYQITLKSAGIYGTANPNNPTGLGVSKNRINMNKIKSLIINGIDKETTLIDIGGTIRNSTVIFNNIGFYNKAPQCIYADKSNIFFNNCLFTAQDRETIQNNGVQGQFSKITLLNCIIEYCNRGLSLYDSEIRSENTIYRNNNVGIYIGHCKIQNLNSQLYNNTTNTNLINYNTIEASNLVVSSTSQSYGLIEFPKNENNQTTIDLSLYNFIKIQYNCRRSGGSEGRHVLIIPAKEIATQVASQAIVHSSQDLLLVYKLVFSVTAEGINITHSSQTSINNQNVYNRNINTDPTSNASCVVVERVELC